MIESIYIFQLPVEMLFTYLRIISQRKVKVNCRNKLATRPSALFSGSCSTSNSSCEPWARWSRELCKLNENIINTFPPTHHDANSIIYLERQTQSWGTLFPGQSINALHSLMFTSLVAIIHSDEVQRWNFQLLASLPPGWHQEEHLAKPTECKVGAL